MKRLRPTPLPLKAGVLAILTFALGACTAGPDYVRPAAPVTPAFKEAQGWKTATPADDAPRGEWWRPFGDADLDPLVRQVEISNQTLAAAEARVREARAATAAARAGLLPSVSGSASASRGGRGGGASSGSGPGNSFDLALDAGWEIDLWGRVRRGVEASAASAQASAGDLASARLSAQALLVQDYLLLRVQDAEIDLLRSTVAGYERSLQLTNNQYAVGVVARADVVQADAQLKSTQAQVLDATIQRAQLEHAIAVLVGKPPAELEIAPRRFAPTFPDIPLALPSELLERRPDVAAAERRVAAANAQIGVAQAAFFPALSLSASGGLQSSTLGNLLSLPSRTWSLGAGLAQTIFDAGLRQAQKSQAIAAYDEAVANYRATVLAAFQDVEDNLAALRLLEQEAAVQADAVKAAQQAAAIVGNQYKAGIVNYVTVVVLQAAALSAQRTELAIVGRRLTAAVALIKALGGGWNAAALPAP